MIAESAQKWREFMTRLMSRVALVAAVVWGTAVVSLAEQTSTSTETKSFEIIGVDGNQLIVRLPEGTRELAVPDDFRFTVNGQPLSVHELKAGMKGTATITTRTTVTPVTVTEVKNGTVVQRAGSNIIVRTEEGVKMFSQGDVDKRGVKMMRDGRPAQLSDFREGDRLSATIITSRPPRVMTEKEVQATVPTAAEAGGAPPVAAATTPPAATTASATTPPAATTASATTPSATTTASAPTAGAAGTLPKTASSWPLLALAIVLLLAIAIALTLRRRRAR
jgi:LPXTG-motif cell wall-anchored protein